MYTILVVDDHPIVSDGLRMLLKDIEIKPAIEKAENGDEAIEMVRKKSMIL
jgi:YesN/AraC family two-component response regulator